MTSRPQHPSRQVRLGPGVRVPGSALHFSFVPSGGPGGQNVNRRSTRAVLRVDLGALGLPPDAEARLRDRSGQKLTKEGELLISSDRHRSQHRNRAECVDLLRAEVLRALERPKRRKPTRPSRGAVERRIEEKKQRSSIKKQRRWEAE